MRRRLLSASVLAATVVTAAPTAAQHAFSPQGAAYDPAVPTPRAVLGYEIGERFTPHHMIMRYAEQLAATPNLARPTPPQVWWRPPFRRPTRPLIHRRDRYMLRSP